MTTAILSKAPRPKSPAAEPSSQPAATPQAGPKRRIPRKQLALAAVGLALAAGAASYGSYWWSTGRFLESTDDAYVGGNTTVIAPKVAGFIKRVAVTDNQLVHAGDLLIKLDDRDYAAALARAEATVAAQDAAIANLVAARSLQEAMIEQARADEAAAAADLERTQFDVRRYRELSQANAASVQRFQQADADHKKAAAGSLKARAAYDAATRQLAVIDTQKKQAEAALAQAVADREIARLNMAYTELRAPIDGVVGNRSAKTGAFASVGASLLSLVPVQGLWVDANFKESQLASMKPGQRVTIAADILPGEKLAGHVVSLAPATGAQFSVLPPENATGNFTKIVQRVPVRIELDGDAARFGRLRPGLSVTAEVDLRQPHDTPPATPESPKLAERSQP